MRFRTPVWTIAAVALGALAFAQGVGIPSPAGVASTEIRGRYVKADNSPASGLDGDAVYKGGKWIAITYGRPIKRSRDLWGTGANYGKSLNSGAPVWRAGANMSTRIKTEVPLVINGKTVPVGEYSLFIDLKPNNWTLIVSRWAAQKDERTPEKNALWGSYDYTPDKDVVRAPMKLETLAHAVEQLTWEFLDMSDSGGALAISWDKVMGSTPFRVGP
jgi:hypothetical protein